MKFSLSSRILLLLTLACLASKQASAESTLDTGDDGAGWLDESDVEGIEYMNSSEPTPHLTEFPPTFSASQMGDAESEAKNLSEGVECVPDAVCYKDQDCGTDNSESFCAGGAVIGTCNCAACRTGKPCKDDSDCGGLMHACQADTTGLCNCRAAHKANGFPTYLSALQTFCNKRRCDDKSGDEVCLGLPCRSGLCVCP